MKHWHLDWVFTMEDHYTIINNFSNHLKPNCFVRVKLKVIRQCPLISPQGHMIISPWLLCMMFVLLDNTTFGFHPSKNSMIISLEIVIRNKLMWNSLGKITQIC